MMTCEKMRELILTDYSDNELPADTAQLVREHLAACPACAAFEARVRGVAIDPFKDVRPVAPSGDVWRRVKGAVEKKPSGMRLSKPIFAAATVAVMLIAVVLAAGLRRAEDRSLTLYVEEELAYLSAPAETNGLGEYDVLSDLDVSAERFSSRRNLSKTSLV